MRRLTYCLLAGFLLPCGAPVAAQVAAGKALQRDLDHLLTDHGQRGARFGGHVMDIAGGRVLYAHDAYQPLIPASNMKLVVIAAAMSNLGIDFEFATTLSVVGQDLVIVGGGDPTFGDERLAAERNVPITAVFHDWADKLKAAGVRRVAGDIVIDDSIFDQNFVHPNWPSDQFQAWYEAPIGGLNFNANCIAVSIRPADGGRQPIAQFIPGNTLLRLVNRTTTAKKQTVVASRPRNKNDVIVSGGVARPAVLGPLTVPDPGLYFGYVFKTVLASKGIPLDGRVIRRKVDKDGDFRPLGGHLVAEHRAPILDATRRAGRQSLGMMAEGLLKTMGLRASGAASWTSGQLAVVRFLANIGIDTAEVAIDDGSGLSRQNRLSAAATTRVLRQMFISSPPVAKAFRESLAQPGRDGTLKKRLTAPHIKDRVFAKTGYINGVRTLAGYVQTRSGQWLAFAFYYNGAGKTRPLTKRQDQAIEALVNWNDGAAAAPVRTGNAP